MNNTGDEPSGCLRDPELERFKHRPSPSMQRYYDYREADMNIQCETVRELIEALQKVENQDAVVKLPDEYGGTTPISYVSLDYLPNHVFIS